MGFWQGLNQGLDVVREDKARRRELDARQQEIEDERAIRKQEREEDFTFERERFAANLKATQLAPLQQKLMERALYDSEAESITHELSVLKGMGASEETLANAATMSKAALQEAVTAAKTIEEKYAGTPLQFGPAGLDALISTGITTIKGGKAPNMEVAANMFGISPEDLDTPYAGDMTYREAITKALTVPPASETTFIGTNPAKPLESGDLDSIRKGAEKSLLDALNQRTIVLAKEASVFAEREARGETLSDEDKDRKEANLDELSAVNTAKEELGKGGAQSAINLVGGQAIIPYFQNTPTHKTLCDKFCTLFFCKVERVFCKAKGICTPSCQVLHCVKPCVVAQSSKGSIHERPKRHCVSTNSVTRNPFKPFCSSQSNTSPLFL